MSDQRQTIELFGREITLTVHEQLDKYGQFRVALAVDGKERYVGNFTDKGNEDTCICGNGEAEEDRSAVLRCPVHGPATCRGCGQALGMRHQEGCPYMHPWPRDRVDNVQTRIDPE